jgi:hypothetical protein
LAVAGKGVIVGVDAGDLPAVVVQPQPAQPPPTMTAPASDGPPRLAGNELLRAVDAAVGAAAARAALERCDHWVDGVKVAALSRLARTVRAWAVELLAWHATGG